MQHVSTKATAEMALLDYRNGKDIDAEISQVIKDLERPLTALEKIDIDKCIRNVCQETSAQRVTELQRNLRGQSYVSTLLGTLKTHELHGVMIFAGLDRKESQTPLEKMSDETQTRIFYGLRRMSDCIEKLRKNGLWRLDKFTGFWNKQKSPEVKPISDLERQQQLLKLSAHAYRQSADPTTLQQNREREQAIREEWAVMEHEFQMLRNNDNTTVNQLASARDIAVRQLMDWQEEAMHIYAMELIPLLEKRVQELQEAA